MKNTHSSVGTVYFVPTELCLGNGLVVFYRYTVPIGTFVLAVVSLNNYSLCIKRLHFIYPSIRKKALNSEGYNQT